MSSLPKRSSLPDGLVRRGDSIHLCVRVNGRRIRRSAGTVDPRKAKEHLDILVGALRIADITGVRPAFLEPQVSLARLVADVLAELEADRAAQTTLTKYRGVMARFGVFLRQALGREPRVSDISHQLVQDYKVQAQRTPRTRNGHVTGPTKVPSVRTVANELDVIRVFMRRAVARGLLATNPESGVGRARGAYQHRVRWLTDGEVERLLEAAETWDTWHRSHQEKRALLRLVIELYLRTGMRSAELRYLTCDDLVTGPSGATYVLVQPKEINVTVIIPMTSEAYQQMRSGSSKIPSVDLPAEVRHLDARSLRFDEIGQVLYGEVCVAWRPKTTSRRIPLALGAVAVIEAIRTERKRLLANDSVVSRFRAQRSLADPPWLIPDISGLPWRWKQPHVMTVLSKKIGIEPVVRTHDLRHTFATRLRRAGVALETVKELLGHADIKETMMYAHYQDEEGLRAVSRIDGK